MKINWIVRIKNKAFWVAIIPALLLLARQICSLFGISVEVTGLSEKLLSILETVFFILMLLGVVIDPTTSGVSDSERAMTYNEPN